MGSERLLLTKIGTPGGLDEVVNILVPAFNEIGVPTDVLTYCAWNSQHTSNSHYRVILGDGSEYTTRSIQEVISGSKTGAPYSIFHTHTWTISDVIKSYYSSLGGLNALIQAGPTAYTIHSPYELLNDSLLSPSTVKDMFSKVNVVTAVSNWVLEENRKLLGRERNSYRALNNAKVVYNPYDPNFLEMQNKDEIKWRAERIRQKLTPNGERIILEVARVDWCAIPGAGLEAQNTKGQIRNAKAYCSMPEGDRKDSVMAFVGNIDWPIDPNNHDNYGYQTIQRIREISSPKGVKVICSERSSEPFGIEALKVDRNPGNKILLTNYCEREDIAAFYLACRQSDGIFSHPSTNEGFCVSMLHSYLYDIPTVYGLGSGPGEIASKHKIGLGVDPLNADKIKSGLLSVIEYYDEHKRKLTHAMDGLRTAHKPTTIAKQYVEVYNPVIKEYETDKFSRRFPQLPRELITQIISENVTAQGKVGG